VAALRHSSRPGTCTAYYGESYIVQGVNFDVREGEILALLGRNGAGKTSTCGRSHAWMIRNCPRRGLAGSPAVARDEVLSGCKTGRWLVPEDRRIIQGLTVEENLDLAQIAEPVGWSKERIYEHFPAPCGTPRPGGRDPVRR
jgi:branched-chain amino acid transport system ATP-binding protein